MSRVLNIQHGTITVEEPSTVNPADIGHFLTARGWYCNGAMWSRSQYQSLTWEQAVAVEFMNFITLGGVPPR